MYKSNKNKFDSDPDIYSVKLPPINHDRHNNDFSDIALDSCCVTNIGQVGMLPEEITKYADYRLNVYNTFSLMHLSAMGFKAACLSPEMTIGQMQNLGSAMKTEIVVYGKIALMTVKNCLVKSSLDKCGCKRGSVYYLRDRKGICFPVECIKDECVNVIYNSASIYMADRMKELARINASYLRFDFTDESPSEIAAVLKQYESGKKSNEFFTRGHFYNGVM